MSRKSNSEEGIVPFQGTPDKNPKKTENTTKPGIVLESFDLLFSQLDKTKPISFAQIKKQYYKEAKKYHPDKNPEQQEEFKFLSVSYRLLEQVDKGEILEESEISDLAKYLSQSSTEVQEIIIAMIKEKNIANYKALQGIQQTSENTITPENFSQFALSVFTKKEKKSDYDILQKFCSSHALNDDFQKFRIKQQLNDTEMDKSQKELLINLITYSNKFAKDFGKKDFFAKKEQDDMVKFLAKSPPFTREFFLGMIVDNPNKRNAFENAIALYKTKEFYSHATHKQGGLLFNQATYHGENDSFKDLKGRYLKTKILQDFNKKLESAQNSKELENVITAITSSPEYDVLKTRQGLFAKINIGGTDSIKAVDKMIDKAREDMAKMEASPHPEM